MRYAQRDFIGKETNLDKLVDLIQEFFKEEGFRLQMSKHPNGYIIQSKKGGIFRTLLASNRAYTILVEGTSSNFKIKIGIGEWLKNLGVAAAETFFLTPLVAFVEIPEALWSYEIEHHLWHYIETQIDLGIQ